MNPVVRRDPGDRWRLFAVAACGGVVTSQHAVALYVERLRARRAPTQVPAYGRKRWLPATRSNGNRSGVDSTFSLGNPARNRFFLSCMTGLHGRFLYY